MKLEKRTKKNKNKFNNNKKNRMKESNHYYAAMAISNNARQRVCTHFKTHNIDNIEESQDH